MLILENIKFEYANTPILDDVSGSIGPSQKVGLIGVNGAGKSTLLKLIIGELNPDFGVIRNTMRTGYIAQDLAKEFESSGEQSIRGFINSSEIEPFQDFQISKLINLIGLTGKTPNSKFSTLSGGQKTKVSIIKLLLEEPELLILDEPTNFLDIKSANWLMKYLADYKGAVLVVSHDLRLMNRSINKIWFLNEFTHKIEQYKGNYTEFLAQKELEDKHTVQKIIKEQKQYEKMLKVADHLSSQGSDKSKMKAAKFREKAKELKANRTTRARKSKKMRLRLDVKQKPGYKVLEVKNVAKAFETDTGHLQVLVDVNFELIRKQRLVIIGVNGAGKSTLLKIITGKLPPDDGPEGQAEINLGHNVDIGYYAQEYEGLDPSLTPMKSFETNDIGKLRSFLGNFLFSGDQIDQEISTLSGGERTRLALARIFWEGHNVLLLDEPTTFLDPLSQEVLIGALESYNETIVLVSHNPDLVQRLKPTHTLLLPEERFTHYDDSLLDRVTIS